MIVFVEGLDRVGKDSLIKALKNKIIDAKQGSFVHTLHYSSVKHPNVEQYSFDQYNDMFTIVKVLDKHDRHIILNRSHIGEYVYGALYRDYKCPEAIFNLEIEDGVAKSISEKAYLIVLVGDVETLAKRAIMENELLSFEDSKMNYIQEKWRFITAFDKYTHMKKKILIDITKDMTKSNVLDIAWDFIKGGL